MRLARILMNGKRETSPRRVAIKGFRAGAGLAENVLFCATRFPTGRDSGFFDWDIEAEEEGFTDSLILTEHSKEPPAAALDWDAGALEIFVEGVDASGDATEGGVEFALGL